MRSLTGKKTIMSEINITPFTDVVLVLLIIFMVATPLIYQGKIKINLPQTSSMQTDEQPQNIKILVSESGDVYIDDVQYILPVDEIKMKSRIAAAAGKNTNVTVMINGDRNGKYDYVVRVIDIIKSLSIQKIMLGTEMKKNRGR